MRRYLQLFLVLFYIFWLSVSICADSWQIIQNQDISFKIELLSDKSNINIDEQFSLVLSIKHKSQFWDNLWDINIAWLNSFEVIWNYSSTRMNVVNWEVKSIIEKQIILKPLKEWSFTVWPATVNMNWSPINSNSIIISVWKKYNQANDGNITKDDSSKIDILRIFKSEEALLFIFILFLWYYLWQNKKNYNSDLDEKIIHKKIELPKIDDIYFLDKCLDLLKNEVLKNNELEAINVNDSEIYKLESNHLKRLQIKNFIDLIYDIKNWRKKNNNEEVLKLLKEIMKI